MTTYRCVYESGLFERRRVRKLLDQFIDTGHLRSFSESRRLFRSEFGLRGLTEYGLSRLVDTFGR
jgi:hypothetical protein